MAEWLLSCHNSKESSGIATPLSQTMLASSVHEQLNWFLEQLAGDISHFDPTLRPIEIVQSQGYGNMTFYARNMSSVLPTDPESVGVPPELITMAKVPTLRLLKLPFNFIRVARWTARYHKEELFQFREELHRRYWELRQSPEDSLDLVFEVFAPDFLKRCSIVDRARILSAVMVMVVDDTLRKQAASLMGLFTGMETSTSLIGQRIWELREIAEQCGPTVTQELQLGNVDIEAYKKMPQAAPLVEALQPFLKDYGHRGFASELDFESERLVDRPDMILLAIAGQLHASQPPTQRSQSVQENAQQSLSNMKNPIQRMIWSQALGWGQSTIGRREDFKSTLVLSQALLGLAMRRLAHHFYPDQPDDILFFYTWSDFLIFVGSAGRSRTPLDILENRRAELALHRNQPPPPELIWYDTETKHWRQAYEEESLSGPETRRFEGIPASPGRGAVEGIALVTNDPIEAGRRLLEFEGPVVLVTRLTDPAWSSLFARLTAVVTELGGVISHAAIVARENGLPAVVGVPEATKWIRDGLRLRVDGTNGVVEILD